MDRRFRVFGGDDVHPEPAALVEHLHDLGLNVTPHFRGDDQGWFHADLRLPGEPPVEVDCYLATEEGIRAHLNTWAAWVEADERCPIREELMRRIIATPRLYVLLRPAEAEDEGMLDRLCLEACRFLARQTGGLYQADGEGLLAADGTLLLEES
jgi:hypothetical protein